MSRKDQFKQMAGAAVFALTLAAGTAIAAEPVVDAKQLQAMAESAKSPSDHAKIAKQYRLRAEQFEAEAAKHEAELKRLSERPRHAMDYKWPAMTNKQREKQRSLAMQARRAAQENYAIADRHIRLAVESGLAAE